MSNSPDILKAGAVIIQDRKLLVSRSKGKGIYVAPGGKLEDGEDDIAALIRELREEQNITVEPDALELLGTFEAVAASDTRQRIVKMTVYIVSRYIGKLAPSSEIEENAWVNSSTTLSLGSIFEHNVIPMLVERGLID